MRFGNRLVLAAASVWLTVTVLAAVDRSTSALATSANTGLGTGTAKAVPYARVSTAHVSEGLQGTPGTSGTPVSLGIPADPDYLGSRACARCHETAQMQWERSLHVQMTKPVADATILGDFRPEARFTAHGRSYEFGKRDDGRLFVQVMAEGRAAETYDVAYTLGAKRYQGYLALLPDGRIYVLPAFWHVSSRRWVDWKEITPIPDEAHDLKQIWNANCFNCHATNLAQGFDITSKTYKTSWTEMGIGCEACHGPGRPHVTLMEEWEKNPASKQAYSSAVAAAKAGDRSATNRDLSGLLKIFSPRTAAPRQVFDTCAYCHGNKANIYVGFRAGDRYEDYALPFFISAPIPDTDFQGEFWPDGRPNRFNRPQALTLSGCFKAGAVTCTNCHIAHGSRNEFSLKVNPYQGRNGDLLCTQCHTGPTEMRSDGAPAAAPRAEGHALAWPTNAVALRLKLIGTRTPDTPASRVPWTDAEIERHTYHAASSAGSRCVTCHMSDVNWRLLIRRRDHTFQAPVPEVTAAFGTPNACTTCHDDRSPEWAAKRMDAAWGDAARRQADLALADTMYRAGSGDRTVIPALARIAVNRTLGVIHRASAVDFIRQLATGGHAAPSVQSQSSFGAGQRNLTAPELPPAPLPPAVVNAIVGAAADPEPMVRAAAVRALGVVGRQEVVVAAVLARLVDQARVVRAYAAEVLLAFGIASLPGRAGEALTRAQDDLVVSLGMFPDSAEQQTERGWLQAERGQLDAAEQALDAAIHLEPAYARPVVIKGVLAARQERFEEAAVLWKKARSLEPSYPNIDKLIAEAEKRKAP